MNAERKLVNYQIYVEDKTFGFRVRIYFDYAKAPKLHLTYKPHCISCPDEEGLVRRLIPLSLLVELKLIRLIEC